MHYSVWIYTFLAIALVAVWYWKKSQAAKKLDIPVPKKSKYGSITSAQVRAAAAANANTDSKPASESASSSSSSSATALPSSPSSDDLTLDPVENADYVAARFQTRLEMTLLSTYRLIAALLNAGKLNTRKVEKLKDKPSVDAQKSQLLSLARLFPHYDPFSPSLPSLERFTHIRNGTHCIFAKKSQAAGSPDTTAVKALQDATVEEQTLAALPGFIEFTLKVKDSYPKFKESLGTDLPSFDPNDANSFYTVDTKSLLEWPTSKSDFKLDAFVIEISGGHGKTLSSFARTIRTVLKTLSNCDVVIPAETRGESLEDRGLDLFAVQSLSALETSAESEVFSSSRWHFSFLMETFFVTCFAPCYGKNHARYMFAEESGEFDVMQDKCYVLFQPELSFLRHNLSPDTKHTNWEAPKTERDRIRIAFKNAGRAYPIPDSIVYPAAHFIVPPLEPFSGQVIKWWEMKDEEENVAAMNANSSSSSSK